MPSHSNSHNNPDDLRKQPSPEDPKKRRVYKKRNHYNPTLIEIKNYFNLPLEQAANSLNICVSKLKKLCREYGVQKWPSRQLKSAQIQCENLKMLGTNPEDSKNMGVVVDVASSNSQNANGKVFAFVHFCTPASSTTNSSSSSSSSSPPKVTPPNKQLLNSPTAKSSTQPASSSVSSSSASSSTSTPVEPVQQQLVHHQGAHQLTRQSSEGATSSRQHLPTSSRPHPQQQQQLSYDYHQQIPHHNLQFQNPNLHANAVNNQIALSSRTTPNYYQHPSYPSPAAAAAVYSRQHSTESLQVPQQYHHHHHHHQVMTSPASVPHQQQLNRYTPEVRVIHDESADDEVRVITTPSVTYNYQQYPQQQQVVVPQYQYAPYHETVPHQKLLNIGASSYPVQYTSTASDAPAFYHYHQDPQLHPAAAASSRAVYNYSYPEGSEFYHEELGPYSNSDETNYYYHHNPGYGDTSVPDEGVVVANDYQYPGVPVLEDNHYQNKPSEQKQELSVQQTLQPSKEYSGKQTSQNGDASIEPTPLSLAPTSSRHTLCRPIPKRAGNFLPFQQVTPPSSSTSAEEHRS